MKKVLLLLLPLQLLLFAACEKEVKSYDLAVDLQASFDHDDVKIYVDGNLEFDRQATTNHALGFAGGTTTVRNPGNHQLKVVVNNTVIKTAVFPLNASLFIGVNFDAPTQRITVQYSNHPFAYD